MIGRSDKMLSIPIPHHVLGYSSEADQGMYQCLCFEYIGEFNFNTSTSL